MAGGHGGEVELQRLVARLMGDATSYLHMLDAATAATAHTTSVIQSLGKAMLLGVTAPLAGIGGLAIKSFADFDQALTKSTSIMDVTEDQVKAMRDAALDLSMTTARDPAHLAKSFYDLASAGMDAERAMRALPIIHKFAVAGAFDMSTATRAATTAVQGLGLASGTAADYERELTRVTDVLALASKRSGTTIEEFSQAMSRQAAASLKTYNKSLEEGAALLAAYGKQGIRGTIAGGQLARLNSLLADSTRKAGAAQEEYNFRVFEGGKMRHYADILADLERITGGMGAEQKSATLSQLGFTVMIQRSILPLIGMSGELRKFNDEFDRAGGTSYRIAGRQLMSFTNQMKLLKNNLTVVAIEIGEVLAPALHEMSAVIRGGVKWWRGLSDETKRTVVVVGALAATIGPLLIAGAVLGPIFAKSFGLLATVTGALLTPFKVFQLGFAGVWAAIIGVGPLLLAILNPIRLVTLAFGALKFAIGAAFGPAGLLIVAALAAVGYFTTELGGAAEAWGRIKAGGQAFLEWARPVGTALASFFTTAWEHIRNAGVVTWDFLKATIGAFAGWVGSTFFGMSGEVTVSFETIRDSVRDAIYFAEFTLENFGQVAEYVWANVQLGFLSMVNDVAHFFGTTVPELLGYFARNWKKIFSTAWSFVSNVFMNLASNAANLIAKIWTAMTDPWAEIDWSEGWSGLLDGFENTIDEVLVLTGRAEGEIEGWFRGRRDELGGALEGAFDEFRRGKLMEEFQKVPDWMNPGWWGGAAGAAAAGARDAGAQTGGAFNKGLADQVKLADAVLAGSAESLARTAEYRERVAESMMGVRHGGAGGRGGSPSAVPAGGAGARDRSEDYLKDIRDLLRDERGGPEGAEVDWAGLE